MSGLSTFKISDIYPDKSGMSAMHGPYGGLLWIIDVRRLGKFCRIWSI